MKTYVHICGGFRRLAHWMFVLILSISVTCWLLMLTLILLSLEQTCYSHLNTLPLACNCAYSAYYSCILVSCICTKVELFIELIFIASSKDWLFSYVHLPWVSSPYTLLCGLLLMLLFLAFSFCIIYFIQELFKTVSERTFYFCYFKI